MKLSILGTACIAVLCPSVIANPIKRASSLPSYVTQYAPILYLDQDEQYFPSDLSQQLVHTIPEVNTTVITDGPSPLTLDNLNQLNNFGNGGINVYLTSREGIEASPSWFNGVPPDSSGRTENAISCAIVTVDHGSGLVDAFYFYFYAYNKGTDFLGDASLEFGDHVGDWEHTMLRFQNGLPQSIWLSQHDVGEAFTYGAMQKIGVRPVVYVARGTHANYAISGTHQVSIYNLNLPVGPVEDHTSQGDLWDPTLSAYSYSYSPSSNSFTAYAGTSTANWLYFLGHWGDAQLPDSTPGQLDVFGERKYVAGPTGPIDKTLNRQDVCPSTSACIVRPILTP